MFVKHHKKLILKRNDHTTNIRFYWNCEEDDIDDENIKIIKFHKEVEKDMRKR
jgi:hypothetical protein